MRLAKNPRQTQGKLVGCLYLPDQHPLLGFFLEREEVGKRRQRAENLGRPNILSGSQAQRGTGAFSLTSGSGACCPLQAVAPLPLTTAGLCALVSPLRPLQGRAGAGSQVIIANPAPREAGVGAPARGGRPGGARA